MTAAEYTHWRNTAPPAEVFSIEHQARLWRAKTREHPDCWGDGGTALEEMALVWLRFGRGKGRVAA